MSPFPALLSIPHGGAEVPREIRDRVTLSVKDQFEDSDSYTQEIYGFGSEVLVQVQSQVARAFVDMNRAEDDRPPKNLDGIVKTQTCHSKTVYLSGQELDDSWTRYLLLSVSSIHCHRTGRAHRSSTRAGLPHTMEAMAPAIAPDTGQSRPLICLGTNHGKSCPPEMADRLAACFREGFGLGEMDVVMNKPFSGGYITRTYGKGILPWVQVEMNRSLYLSEPWFDADTLIIQPQRLLDLNQRFRKTRTLFFQSWNRLHFDVEFAGFWLAHPVQW